MKLSRTLMMTAAGVVLLSTGAIAEGTSVNNGMNTDEGAYNQRNDTSVQGDTSANIEPSAGVGMDTNTNASADVSASTNMDSSTIQNAQNSLRDEGYSISVDGVWGPETAAALRQFQQENGLDATGALDSETMAALDIQQ